MIHKMQSNIIYIVNAGNDDRVSSIANDYSFPALSALALGTWLQIHVPEVEVIARDGGVATQARVLAEIRKYRPGLVSVSVLSMSYQNALEIAEVAHNVGSYVLFGNDHASQLSHEILQKRPSVDFILGSEYGELPLELLVRSLLNGDDLYTRILDLTYRDKNGEVVGYKYERDKHLLPITRSPIYLSNFGNLKRKTSMDVLPLTNRNLYPADHWQTYLHNYKIRFSHLHVGEEITGVTTMNRLRGCSRAQNPCSFCDILTLDPQFSSADTFWKEVEKAHEQVQANVFYEVCDSFSSFPNVIENIASSKPKHLGFEPGFFVYTQAIDLVRRPSLVDDLKKMGVFKVNVGLESGCNTTLKHLKSHRDSVETNEKALKLLKQKGINVYGSLVLGSEAETTETLKETVAWAKKIIDNNLVADIEASHVFPLVGNYQGRQMKERGLFGVDNENPDWPVNVNLLSRVYIENFSGVSYEQVREALEEIISHAKRQGINSGSGVSLEV
jgi:radical SAM superfamily enzyme YgiQ (UPF0313 family)